MSKSELLQMAMLKPILTADETCAYIGLSKSRLYVLCSQKQIPHYKQGKLYFVREELDKWLTSKRVPTAQEVESKVTFEALRRKANKH